MEPRGCNRWEPVANRAARRTAQTGETVAVGFERLPRTAHGKEGVDVRVRQRASQKSREPRLSLSDVDHELVDQLRLVEAGVIFVSTTIRSRFGRKSMRVREPP